MPKKPTNLTGMQFGRLAVINRVDGDNSKCVCRCTCGSIKTYWSSALTGGRTQSCGCLRADIGPHNKRHGMTGSPTYKSWQKMISRCNKPNDPSYKDYGARGITICEQWYLFDNFLADMGIKPEDKTIDRINNDGNYHPDNCQWSNKTEQANNRRTSRIITHNGESLTLAQFARKFNISIGTLWYRLKSGWSMDRALNEHVEVGNNQFTA